MKELSIEEKVKRYDEAVKKAESLYKASEPMSACNVILEVVFPELKESEDEKIRTAILNHLKKMWGNCKDDICGVHIEDAIAWLENKKNL